MPAVPARPISQIAGLALTGATAVALAGALAPDAATPAAPAGLSASYSGPVFAADGDQPPALRLSRLAPGHAASGTIKVTNPGPGSRLFWLGAGRVDDWVGSHGGRLSTDTALTVLDVTRVSQPSEVYRGPADALGARPLGFLSAGSSRTFSVTASLPTDTGLPATAGANPYAGSRLTMPLVWHSLEGSPAPATIAAARPRRAAAPRRPVDHTGPKLTVAVDRTHHPLETGRLAFVVRCGERCTPSAASTVRIGARSWKVTARRSSRGARWAAMALPVPPGAMQAMRTALTSGRTASIRIVAAARDRHGNRSVDRHHVTLQPRR